MQGAASGGDMSGEGISAGGRTMGYGSGNKLGRNTLFHLNKPTVLRSGQPGFSVVLEGCGREKRTDTPAESGSMWGA